MQKKYERAAHDWVLAGARCLFRIRAVTGGFRRGDLGSYIEFEAKPVPFRGMPPEFGRCPWVHDVAQVYGPGGCGARQWASPRGARSSGSAFRPLYSGFIYFYSLGWRGAKPRQDTQ
jgi:hypothetical protein